ncbi:MAG: hypothetical protein SOV63_03700 [Pyramidobacter porci]|uniref:hypothetical protein n=1 Tax=Pyramidobacter porci TaxID=2605789 RepID=UPI002A758708|nr:hypothetical protein [Pyramidobacter porci]MDY2647892.1 hypothetical protein [Pyramidobacter porci]
MSAEIMGGSFVPAGYTSRVAPPEPWSVDVDGVTVTREFVGAAIERWLKEGASAEDLSRALKVPVGALATYRANPLQIPRGIVPKFMAVYRGQDKLSCVAKPGASGGAPVPAPKKAEKKRGVGKISLSLLKRDDPRYKVLRGLRLLVDVFHVSQKKIAAAAEVSAMTVSLWYRLERYPKRAKALAILEMAARGRKRRAASAATGTAPLRAPTPTKEAPSPIIPQRADEISTAGGRNDDLPEKPKTENERLRKRHQADLEVIAFLAGKLLQAERDKLAREDAHRMGAAKS